MKEKELERLLKSLANKRRMMILKHLKYKGGCTVGTIAEEIELSFKSTSKHAMILFHANVVEKKQISLAVVYSLSKKTDPLTKALLNFL